MKHNEELGLNDEMKLIFLSEEKSAGAPLGLNVASHDAQACSRGTFTPLVMSRNFEHRAIHLP